MELDSISLEASLSMLHAASSLTTLRVDKCLHPWGQRQWDLLTTFATIFAVSAAILREFIPCSKWQSMPCIGPCKVNDCIWEVLLRWQRKQAQLHVGENLEYQAATLECNHFLKHW